MEKLEMKYKEFDGIKILYSGTYKNFNYWIFNVRGTHPCAYVEVTGTKYDESQEFNTLDIIQRKSYWLNYENRAKRDMAEKELNVHGGVTYSSGFLTKVYMPKIEENRTRWFIGWDYSHFGDYNTKINFTGREKRYTTEEVIKDCEDCIKQIIEKNKV